MTMLNQPTELPELVHDSKLPASFDLNQVTHNKPSSRRNLQRKETWRQETMLGLGGGGVVWLQRRVSSGSAAPELRAVKQIRTDSNTGWKYYWRELEALAKFSQDKYSDFFTQSYGWYEDSMYLYVAMEYCEYGDLGAYLKAEGTVPEDQAQYLASQVLGGLSMMHTAGFAHQDIKPSNILIKSKPPEDWWIKICDLGLSKRTEHAAGSTAVRATPGFLPPEIVGFYSGPETPNPLSSDMWCYGETVFHMLVGRGAFGNLLELQRYCKGKSKFPVEGLDASESAGDFVRSLMAANPGKRLTATTAKAHSWMTPARSQFETLLEATPFLRGEGDIRPAHLPMAGEWTQASAAWSEIEPYKDAFGEVTQVARDDQISGPPLPSKEDDNDTNPERVRGDISNQHIYRAPEAEFETEYRSDDSNSRRSTTRITAPSQITTHQPTHFQPPAINYDKPDQHPSIPFFSPRSSLQRNQKNTTSVDSHVRSIRTSPKPTTISTKAPDNRDRGRGRSRLQLQEEDGSESDEGYDQWNGNYYTRRDRMSGNDMRSSSYLQKYHGQPI